MELLDSVLLMHSLFGQSKKGNKIVDCLIEMSNLMAPIMFSKINLSKEFQEEKFLQGKSVRKQVGSAFCKELMYTPQRKVLLRLIPQHNPHMSKEEVEIHVKRIVDLNEATKEKTTESEVNLGDPVEEEGTVEPENASDWMLALNNFTAQL